MLALDSLIKRVSEERGQYNKFARIPNYGDDVKWLLDISKRLGLNYLYLYIEKVLSAPILSPFLLQVLTFQIVLIEWFALNIILFLSGFGPRMRQILCPTKFSRLPGITRLQATSTRQRKFTTANQPLLRLLQHLLLPEVVSHCTSRLWRFHLDSQACQTGIFVDATWNSCVWPPFRKN